VHAVRGPKHVMETGKTTVLDAELLADCIERSLDRLTHHHPLPEQVSDGQTWASIYRLSRLADAVGMRTRAGQLAAIHDQILLANRAILKPAFKDLPGPGGVAGLSGQRCP
jgi:hypothetical protein